MQGTRWRRTALFILFLTLTIFCLLFLIVGFILMLVRSGSTTRESGMEIGADMMGEIFDNDELDGVNLSNSKEMHVFHGQARQVSVQSEYSFSEIKDLLVSNRWHTAIPVVLAMLGLVGFLFFGALTLFQVLEERWLAYLLLGLVVYSIVRISIQFLRA